MRILIFGLNFAPELTSTGKYTGEMAAYLATQGHEVRVVTAPPYYPQWNISKPYTGWRYQRELWAGVDVFRCPLWVPKKPSGLKRVLHLLSFMFSSIPVVLGQKKWQPEIILTIAPSLFSALPALLLGKLSGGKTWLHIQDFELDAAFDLGLISGKRWLYKTAQGIELALLKRFDRVSTISNCMLERLWQKGVEQERSILFPNWVDTDLIKPLPQPSNLRKEWGISDDKIIILYSGNMGRKQGLEILIDAARELAVNPKILFLLCGDGAVRVELQEIAHGLSNIRFYPIQPLERLNELLNLADIHILPQRADAADLVMPSKLSGMLASGKVVVATASPESELGSVVSEVGVLTPPGNAEQLSDVLQKLASNPENRAVLGEKGRNWVLLQWSKETVLSRFCKTLHCI